VSNREIVFRNCHLCEAHCGVAIEVDREAGRVVTVRGDDDDPFSRGYLCPKAYGLKGLHEDPDRLRAPLVRRGGDLVEVGWDEALDRAAEGLRRVRDAHGADAVATYLGNPTVHDLGATLLAAPLQRSLGTRWRFSATSVDQLPKMLSSCLLYGAPGLFPVPDVDRTDFLLMLGANPLASNGSLMTAPDMKGRLARLRERGGRLVVVDPRRSETAAVADQHIFLRPGGDAFFLLSILQVLFAEERTDLGAVAPFTTGLERLGALAADFPPEATASRTGVPADVVRELARDFAAAERAVCYGRLGTCTQAYGALASWLLDCVTLVTGNLDRPGGALFPRGPAGPASDVPRRKGRVPYARWHSRVRGLPEFAGELPVAALAEEIDAAGEERIRALFTMAGNPVLSTPNGDRLDAALASLDFMVSVDPYLNETTRHADVVLPPESPLERPNHELGFQGLRVRHVAKAGPAVFERPPGALSQWRILAELAGRFAGADAAAVEETMLGGLLAGAVGQPGTACPDVRPEQAREQLAKWEGAERIYDLMLRAGPWGDRFDEASDGLSLARLLDAPHGIDLGPLEPRLPTLLATADGGIDLVPELLARDAERLRADLAAPAAGTVLIGRRHLRSNNSWMHNLRSLAKGPERCTLLVHPDDAARAGLSDGGRARVSSRVGAVEVPVRISDEMMPGVVSLPHGFGHDLPGIRLGVAREHAGVNSNRLTDEQDVDALSANAVLNGIPVELAGA